VGASFVVLRRVGIRLFEPFSVAGPTAQSKTVVPVATVTILGPLVAVADIELIKRYAAVGNGNFRRPVDVFPELSIYFVCVGPRRNRALTRGERDTPTMLALDAPVLVVRTGTMIFPSVYAVFSVSILTDDCVDVAALG
jgi:hypothetical protein